VPLQPRREFVQRSPSDDDDDSVWDDVETSIKDPEEEQTRPLLTTPSPSGSIRSFPRKRKPVYKTTYTASSSRRPPATLISSRQPRPPVIVRKEEIIDGALQGAWFTLQYLFDIFSTAIRLLRIPLGWMVFLWLLALIIARISRTLQPTFAPLCHLPGLYGSRFCRPPDIHGKEKLPKWADYPKLIDVQSITFEHLLDGSAGGSGLSLEIKKAQIATADLATLVRVSNLKSRDLLADSLVEFVNDAKYTGSGLQRLSSRIGGAVDRYVLRFVYIIFSFIVPCSIMAVNDYALHSIEAAQSKTSWLSVHALSPWSRTQPTSEIVTQTFTEAMFVLSNAMERLILEAEVNIGNLNKLEERLLTLHEIVSREDSTLSSAQAELLSELWTKVGGNKKTLRNFESHLALLKNLGVYRKKALVHVVAALQTLQAMSSDMEDIRERVAAPELTISKIPVKVHIESIRIGLERLKEKRVQAKRLEEEAVRHVLIGDTPSTIK
jgi:hypothetical protein